MAEEIADILSSRPGPSASSAGIFQSTGTSLQEFRSRFKGFEGTSLDDSIGAAVERGFRELPSLGLFNRITQEEDDGEEIDPGKLNELFPDFSSIRPFKDPATLREANRRAEDIRTELMLEEIIAAGPSDGFSRSMIFGASLIPSLTDPIEIGLSLAVGFGLSAAAKAGRLGATVFGGLTSTPFRRGISEGVGATLITEPFVRMERDRLNDELSAFESAVSVLGAPALFGGIRLGHRAIRNRFGGGLTDETVENLSEIASNQLAHDRKVNVSPVVDDIERSNSGVFSISDQVEDASSPRLFSEPGSPQGGRSGLFTSDRLSRQKEVEDAFPGASLSRNQGLPILEPADISNRSFFGALSSRIRARDPIVAIREFLFEGGFGDGFLLDDNIIKINSIATSQPGRRVSRLGQFSIDPEARLIDLDLPLFPDDLRILKNALGPRKGKLANDEFLSTATGREIFSEFRDEVIHGTPNAGDPFDEFDQFLRDVRDSGVDGFRLRNIPDEGEGVASNSVMLFDTRSNSGNLIAKPTATFRPNAEINRPSRDAVIAVAEEQRSYRSGIDHDEPTYQRFLDDAAERKHDPEIGDIDSELKGAIQEMRPLVDSGVIGEDTVSAIQKANARIDTEHELMKSVSICMRS